MQLADARVSERPLFSERDRWFESAFLQRRVSCEPDFLPLNSRYFRPVRRKETRARRWDLQFESTSLQRRVSLSRDFFFVGQEPRLSARVCRAAFLARSAAASLRRSRLTSSPSSQSIDYPRYCASYLVALTLGPGNPTIAPRPSSTIPTAVTAWQLP
jgi:hypothetical protein